jgi:hypothetical protein
MPSAGGWSNAGWSESPSNGWRRRAVDLPGFDAWAAIVEGELAATILTTRIEDTYCVPCAQANSKYLKMHVNNALFYAASCEILAREGVGGIFFSLHSLDAPDSVNEFKFRMGLMAKPVRQRITFHPLVRSLANRFVQRTLSKWTARHPDDQFGAKAEGMLRFHLQGRLPLHEQCWPDCLSEYKAKVLGREVAESGGRESGVRVLMEVEGRP